jgi:hypothetical protein
LGFPTSVGPNLPSLFHESRSLGFPFGIRIENVCEKVHSIYDVAGVKGVEGTELEPLHTKIGI